MAGTVWQPSVELIDTFRRVDGEDTNYVSEQCLPHPKLNLMEQIDSEQCIHVEARDAAHEGILNVQLAFNR